MGVADKSESFIISHTEILKQLDFASSIFMGPHQQIYTYKRKIIRVKTIINPAPVPWKKLR
jgi:hypothetical protein